MDMAISFIKDMLYIFMAGKMWQFYIIIIPIISVIEACWVIQLTDRGTQEKKTGGLTGKWSYKITPRLQEIHMTGNIFNFSSPRAID